MVTVLGPWSARRRSSSTTAAAFAALTIPNSASFCANCARSLINAVSFSRVLIAISVALLSIPLIMATPTRDEEQEKSMMDE
jgi:hypothetical protein